MLLRGRRAAIARRGGRVGRRRGRRGLLLGLGAATAATHHGEESPSKDEPNDFLHIVSPPINRLDGRGGIIESQRPYVNIAFAERALQACLCSALRFSIQR